MAATGPDLQTRTIILEPDRQTLPIGIILLPHRQMQTGTIQILQGFKQRPIALGEQFLRNMYFEVRINTNEMRVESSMMNLR